MTTLVLVALLVAGPPPADAPDRYQPLAFLVGRCWKGTLPGGSDTDEHCFSWVYPHKFVRDRHVVHGAGHADYLGESIYYWNSAEGRLEYLYIESDGGFSHGPVSATGDALIFPPTGYVENGHTRHYRSRWQRSGADAYEVVTEFEVDSGWGPGFTVHMEKSAIAPAP